MILLVLMHILLQFYIILVVNADSLFLPKHFKRHLYFVSSVFLFLRGTNQNCLPFIFLLCGVSRLS